MCPEVEGEERIDVILEIPGKFKMERIHSNNSKSEEGYWYDQDQSEWVMVLKGKATVEFEEDKRVIEMKEGDTLLIKPHEKHRVASTDPFPGTIWLALFW